uniref:G_PROTEIN_RECEP_F1_2 domain-containing protein n=1 Tax=Macrostomum lignano TaxID=282301 RepID=A0A1I8FGQ8_9PLAT
GVSRWIGFPFGGFASEFRQYRNIGASAPRGHLAPPPRRPHFKFFITACHSQQFAVGADKAEAPFMISGLSFATFGCGARTNASTAAASLHPGGLTSVTFKVDSWRSRCLRISYLTATCFLLLLLLLPLVKGKAARKRQGGWSASGGRSPPGRRRSTSSVLMSLAILCIVSIWHAVVTMIQTAEPGRQRWPSQPDPTGRDGELGGGQLASRCASASCKAESGEPLQPPPAPHGDGEQDREGRLISFSVLYVLAHRVSKAAEMRKKDREYKNKIQFYQMVESHGRGANRKNSVGADLARRQHHQHHHTGGITIS